ncbi:MAG TPA: creatininase family protein [Ktedonobacterales bacterium]|nr:creatininase family protein [Ktedonobacterales bacterium]
MEMHQQSITDQQGTMTIMRWEALTGDQFPKAIEQSQGVCLIALSVLERHGHHLPLGTDMFVGHALLDRVAQMEPVLLFPDYFLTQIPEARHCAGTISIDPALMVRLLDNVCREIARNGVKKIVLVNCHGGNSSFLPLFTEWQLATPHDYAVYLVQPHAVIYGATGLPWAAESDGHAGPSETSMMLQARPDLVDLSQVPTFDEGQALHRLRALEEAGVRTGMWWYAQYPTHYAGDARLASAEAGEDLLERMAQHVVRAVRAIKADTETLRLQNEFYAASQVPAPPRLP